MHDNTPEKRLKTLFTMYIHDIKLTNLNYPYNSPYSDSLSLKEKISKRPLVMYILAMKNTYLQP